MDENATKSNGFKYWKYVPIFTDDLLVISRHYQLVMKGFYKAYTLYIGANKGNKLDEHTAYLGIGGRHYFVARVYFQLYDS